MQNTCGVNCNWSKAILVQEGWESADSLFEKLRAVPEKEFAKNKLPVKTDFITGLTKLIVSIELDGDAVKEARQMTSPGSLFESLSSDYLFIRARYLQKRTKLKEQLALIKRTLSGL